MNKVSAWLALMIFASMMFWFGIIYYVITSQATIHRQAKEINNLNNEMVKVVINHNELNHKNNELKDELFWIRHVNRELLDKCDPSAVNSVIKHTPLPKLKVNT